jgi:hypothetical protein
MENMEYMEYIAGLRSTPGVADLPGGAFQVKRCVALCLALQPQRGEPLRINIA